MSDTTLSPLARQMRGVGIGVLIALALLGGRFLLMKSAGHALAQHWEHDVGYPDIDRILPADASPALATLHQDCKASSASARLAPALDRQLTGSDQMAGSEILVAQRAGFLGCLMQADPARLCDPPQKAHLTAAITDYLSLMRKVKEDWQMEGAAYGGAVQGPAGVSVTLPSDGVDADVAQDMRRLAAKGYLRASDFGGFMGFGAPPQISAVLDGVKHEGPAPCH